MGDPKKSRKKYTTPGHPYEQARLESELVIVGKFGLRNKRELWNARTQLGAYRKQARALLALDPEEKERKEKILLSKLLRLGILKKEDATTDDILALEVEAILSRRLQTRVYELGLANSVHHARQLITHRHILFGDHIMNVPGFLVPIAEEHKIAYASNSPYNDPSHPMLQRIKAEQDVNVPTKKVEEPKGRGRRY